MALATARPASKRGTLHHAHRPSLARRTPGRCPLGRPSPDILRLLPELLLADQPLRFARDTEPPADLKPQRRADTALTGLLELIVAHLSHLPEPEAADRVTLTVRFLNSGLARWERDNRGDAHRVAPLTSFTLILSDLAVAMLDAPSSVPPESDAYFGHPHLVGHQALPATRPSVRRLWSGDRSSHAMRCLRAGQLTSHRATMGRGHARRSLRGARGARRRCLVVVTAGLRGSG
jgi:hypothetical protein